MRVADLERNQQVTDRPSSRGGRTSTRQGGARTGARTKTRVQIRADILESSRPKARAQGSFLNDVLINVVICGAVFAGTYGARCLYGQVEVETARAAESAARARVSEARRAEAGLRAQVDRLKNPLEIDDWAKKHGYVLVARREEPAED